MGRKNRFVQDTEVLIYRLNHGNIAEAKRILEQISLVAGSLAQELEEGRRKQFLEGTSELMSRFRERISELEAEGKSEEEMAETVLGEMNEHFSYDLTEFSLTPRSGPESLDWESTADQLVEENQWLREELEKAEEDYMGLYKRAEDDGEEKEAS